MSDSSNHSVEQAVESGHGSGAVIATNALLTSVSARKHELAKELEGIARGLDEIAQVVGADDLGSVELSRLEARLRALVSRGGSAAALAGRLLRQLRAAQH